MNIGTGRQNTRLHHALQGLQIAQSGIRNGRAGKGVVVGQRQDDTPHRSSKKGAFMLSVTDNLGMQRFEMTAGNAVAFLAYRRDGDQVVLTHTEVPDSMAGQGVGTRLVAGALDLLRADGQTVVPQCEFVVAFIQKHPGYQSLIARD